MKSIKLYALIHPYPIIYSPHRLKVYDYDKLMLPKKSKVPQNTYQLSNSLSQISLDNLATNTLNNQLNVPQRKKKKRKRVNESTLSHTARVYPCY